MQIKVIQILFDQFMLYGMNFMEAKGAPVRSSLVFTELSLTATLQSEQVVDFLMQKLDDRPEVQATAAVGFSKLMLSGMLTDAEVSPIRVDGEAT